MKSCVVVGLATVERASLDAFFSKTQENQPNRTEPNRTRENESKRATQILYSKSRHDDQKVLPVEGA